MRLLLATALLAALLVPAAHASPRTGFAFGREGGNIMPFTISISTSGVVTATGAAPAHRSHLTKLQVANLDRLVVAADFARLPASTSCPGALPDVATESIRVGPRTVRVHGGCVPRFDRLWAAFGKAVR